MASPIKFRALTTMTLLSISLFNLSAQESEQETQQTPPPKEPSELQSNDFVSNFGRGICCFQYQFMSFDDMKHSGAYGFRDIITAYQSRHDHFCISFGVSLNLGIVNDYDGAIINLGPAYRRDISKSFSFAIPFELLCEVLSHQTVDKKGISDYKTDVTFGGQLSAIMMYKPEKVGFFFGPQLTIVDSSASFGAVIGIGF